MTTRCRQVHKIPTALYGLLFLDSAAVTEIDNGFITFCFFDKKNNGTPFCTNSYQQRFDFRSSVGHLHGFSCNKGWAIIVKSHPFKSWCSSTVIATLQHTYLQLRSSARFANASRSVRSFPSRRFQKEILNFIALIKLSSAAWSLNHK